MINSDCNSVCCFLEQCSMVKPLFEFADKNSEVVGCKEFVSENVEELH